MIRRLLNWAIDRLESIAVRSISTAGARASGQTPQINQCVEANANQLPLESKAAAITMSIFGIPEASLLSNKRLVEDLGANAQLMAELIMQLEDEFMVELPDELAEADNITLSDIVIAIRAAQEESIK